MNTQKFEFAAQKELFTNTHFFTYHTYSTSRQSSSLHTYRYILMLVGSVPPVELSTNVSGVRGTFGGEMQIFEEHEI